EALFQLDYRLWWYFTPLYRPKNFRGNAENVFGKVGSWNMVGVPREVELPVQGREITDPTTWLPAQFGNSPGSSTTWSLARRREQPADRFGIAPAKLDLDCRDPWPQRSRHAHQVLGGGDGDRVEPGGALDQPFDLGGCVGMVIGEGGPLDQLDRQVLQRGE